MGSGFSIFESRAGLADLETAWRGLAESDENAFLTPEWFHASLATYGESSSPFVATVHDSGGVLRAIAPMVREGKGKGGVIRFAGANLGDSYAPAGDIDHQRELARGLGAELAGRRDWTAVVLDNVPKDRTQWIAEFAAAGLSTTPLPHRDQVLPSASLEGISWDEFLAARSRNFRSQLGRKGRALERDHEPVYRLVKTADELPEAMEAFERLHHARWIERGGSQALTDRSKRFHEEFAREALERGWLRLWLLEIDSQPAAAWYGWRIGGRYAYYQAGFDPAWSRQSVGLLLQARTVRAAIEEGASTYDLLLGGEEYKSRFADGEEQVHTYTVTRKLSRARALARAEVLARASADRLSPELRAKVKDRLGGLARRAPSDVRR